MPDTLKLYRDDADTSGLDLSSYVDVAEGGINPGDESVRNPVMSQGALGYGEHLVHVQIKARSFTAALLLFGTTHDALAALQHEIEARLVGGRPVIEWARQGASSSTWFRVRYGRVLGDARYDQKRESQTRYAKRLLALVVEPYGTGSRVLYSTGAASAPVMAPPTGAGWASIGLTSGKIAGIAPSNPAMGMLPSVGGDAAVRWRIGVGATTASAFPAGLAGGSGFFPGRAAFGISATVYSVAGLNAGSWSASAARLRVNRHGATWLADPWAPGGGFGAYIAGTVLSTGGQVRLDPTLDQALGSWAPSAPPGGLYRLFACIRARQDTAAGSNRPAVAQVISRGIRGPIATLALRSPSQWAWYDMGDVLDLNDVGFAIGFPTGFTGAASPAFNLTAFAAIPKQIAYWEVDNQSGASSTEALAVSADNDDGITPAGKIANHRLVDFSRTEVLSQRGAFRGALPVTPPLGSGATAAWHLAVLAFRDSSLNNVQSTAAHHPNERAIVSVIAHDRYTFAK